MVFFFQKKVNAENSSLKNKIKRLVRSSLIDTLTLDFVSLRAFDKIKLHVIYVLDGRHGFWPVSYVKISDLEWTFRITSIDLYFLLLKSHNNNNHAYCTCTFCQLNTCIKYHHFFTKSMYKCSNISPCNWSTLN